jgi:hypothetical protein
MAPTRTLLTVVLTLALMGCASDCAAMATPEQAMECCKNMCPSHNQQHSQDCCQEMPSTHAPFLQSSSIQHTAPEWNVVAIPVGISPVHDLSSPVHNLVVAQSHAPPAAQIASALPLRI